MKIYSVIVCFNPIVDRLYQLCRALLDSHSAVILVDNTEKSYIQVPDNSPDCILIKLGENTGIAHAQNIGIREAIKEGAQVVVFFDQDSSIGSDFLPKLISSLNVGVPGVAAPIFFDQTKGFEFPAIRLAWYGRPIKVYQEARQNPYNVDVITSSGSAATVETFSVAGFMDEDLFIDFVDIEWSLRCRYKNIPIKVVPNAVMRHSVGGRSINFGFIRGFVHGPERTYYKVRNCFMLFGKESVPLFLACKETVSAFVHQLMMFPFLETKGEYLSSYYWAVVHGITGVAGKKPAKQL